MAYSARNAVLPGVSASTLALFFRELAVLLEAGLPLDDALESAGMTGAPQLAYAARELARGVRDGQPVSAGIRAFGTLFHPVIPAIIAAAEQSGDLAGACRTLESYFNFETGIVRSVKQALQYPAMTLIVAVLATTVLFWIGFLPVKYVYLPLALIAAAVVLFLFFRLRSTQALARYLIMPVPFFGTLVRQLAIARFCNTFASLIRAGVPYLEGLETTIPVVQHPLVAAGVRNVYFAVRNGNTVQDSIRAEMTFPPVVINLVGAGEVAGTLDEALFKAAKLLQDDAEYKIRAAAKTAGPLMTILVGIIVLLIAVGFLGSYFDKILGLANE